MEIDLDEVRKEWMHSDGPKHIKSVATHYGVYKDLFGRADFVPRVPLTIEVS